MLKVANNMRRERIKSMEMIIANVQKKISDQLEELCKKCDSTEISQKDFCKLIELMNATIRLEQAEKRFSVNFKIAVLSFITSIVTSGAVSILLRL